MKQRGRGYKDENDPRCTPEQGLLQMAPERRSELSQTTVLEEGSRCERAEVATFRCQTLQEKAGLTCWGSEAML